MLGRNVVYSRPSASRTTKRVLPLRVSDRSTAAIVVWVSTTPCYPLERLHTISDPDPARREHVRAQPAAVDEVAQDAGVGEALEMGARLAQAAADALGLADAEAPPDERVEVDPAGDDVAARLGGREAELLDDLALDQRQIVAVGVGVGERALVREIAVALEAAAGVGVRAVDELHRGLGGGRDRERLDRAVGAPLARRRHEVVPRDDVAGLDVIEAPAQRRPRKPARRRAVGDRGPVASEESEPRPGPSELLRPPDRQEAGPARGEPDAPRGPRLRVVGRGRGNLGGL